MSDYDTSVGVQLEDNFDKAIANAQRLVNAMKNVEEITKKTVNTLATVNSTVRAMSKLNGMDFSKMDAQVDAMVQSVDSLQTKLSQINTANLIAVANALRTFMNGNQAFNLTGIEKLVEIPSIMKSIEALDSTKLGKVFSTLATQIQPFIAKLKEAREDLKNLATISTSSMGKVKTNITKAQDSVKKLGNESANAGKKISKMFTVGNMIYFFNMSKRLFSGFGNMLNKSIDFAETENLFSVAMRDMRSEAMKFQNTMSEAFGLAIPDMMKAQGLFKNMLSAIRGLNQETATGLSEVMTKMSVDFASLYNTSIESAMTKMQAALSRQVRPIRSVSGMDITQNVLGESLKQMGIYDRAVLKLSEMEKRLVIIYTLQQQMARSGAMGDFARTIEQPAQQLKILQQQLSETGRWIGAVFMGTVGKVLPYINGFVMAIKEVIKTFALFVGYKIPDSSGVGNVLDQMDSDAGAFGDTLDGAIDNANDGLDKAKKTVDSLMAPFDKLNIIQKPSEDTSSESSSGASSSVGGIDDRILASLGNYDNMMDNVKMKATAIRDRIMEWLGFTKTIDGLTGETVWKLKEGYTNIEKIRDMFVSAGIVLASWKIAKSVLSFWTALRGGEVKGAFGAMGSLWKSFNNPSGQTIKLMSMFGNKVAFVGTSAIIAGIAATIAIVGLRLYDLVMNNESFRRGIQAIGDIAGAIFGAVGNAISWIGDKLNLSDEATRGCILSLGALALLFTPAAPFALAYLIFEGIATAIKALGYAMSPCIEQFDVLQDASEQTKTNLEPMLDTMDDMETNLKQMDWSNMAPDADAVAKANESVNKFSNDLITHLENSKKKAIDTMSDLFQKSTFSQEEQNEMIKGVNTTYDSISTKVREAQNTITSIYNTATAENRALSDEEVKTITANQDWLKTQSVATLSASAEEQKMILNNMKANAVALSVEQASEIIKSSIETKQKTNAESLARLEEQKLIAENIRQNGGAEASALADKIIEEATRQHDLSVEQAKLMHENIVNEYKEQNPEIAKYLDEGTGNIKSNFDIWVEEFNSWCSETGASISSWWDNDIAPWFTWEKWKQLGSDAMDGVKGAIDSVLSWFSPITSWWDNNIAPWFTWEKWYNLGMGAIDSVTSAFSNFEFPSFKLPHISWVADGISTSGWIYDVLDALSLPTSLPGLNVSWYRNGGFVGENAGQLFAANEPGNPELVGNIGGHTAVVNNNMIIEAIEGAMTRAVIKGMQSVRTEKSDGTIIIENYYDGELIERKIIEANEKHERKTGKPVFSR